jgi:protein MpaA
VACVRSVVVGYSVQHRAITACERGTAGGVPLLVIGVIHGNEQHGLGVVQRLGSMQVPVGVALWLVPTMNPDGLAADIRTNARGVDENRNFPFGWAPSAVSGFRPLSEPETQAMATFLQSVRPRTVVIFHSPLDAVDYSEGADPAVVRYLASAAGFVARSLGARPGELTGWYNGMSWHPSAVTFEFAQSTSTAQLDRVSRAVLALAAWRAGR